MPPLRQMLLSSFADTPPIRFLSSPFTSAIERRMRMEI